jgi:hypothetical protein
MIDRRNMLGGQANTLPAGYADIVASARGEGNGTFNVPVIKNVEWNLSWQVNWRKYVRACTIKIEEGA